VCATAWGAVRKVGATSATRRSWPRRESFPHFVRFREHRHDLLRPGPETLLELRAAPWHAVGLCWSRYASRPLPPRREPLCRPRRDPATEARDLAQPGRPEERSGHSSARPPCAGMDLTQKRSRRPSASYLQHPGYPS
jgi:hypothetical protein